MFEHTEVVREISRLDKKRVKFPEYVKACNRLSDFIALSENGGAVLLMGDSGVGKSVTSDTLFEACQKIYLPTEPHQKPVVKCRLPSHTGTKSLLEVLLEAVDYPFVNSTSKETWLSTVVAKAYQKLGVRVLFIDEMQRAKHSDKNTALQYVANAFTSLLDGLGIAIVMIGTPDLQSFADQFEPFQGRSLKRVIMNPFDAPDANGSNDLRNFVGTLARHLPSPIDAALLSDEGLQFLHKATRGKARVICELLKIAATEEVRECGEVPSIIPFERFKLAATGMKL